VSGAPLPEEDQKIVGLIRDANFWSHLIAKGEHKNDPRLKNAAIVLPIEENEPSREEELTTMGMTARTSLELSGDQLQDNWCAEGHDQGTLNNRFCHSAVARSFASWLEKKGLDPTLASFAGGIFWVPKEFFMDMNPSAHDIAFTYVDKLGTRSTTLEVTVFGDALFERYMGRGFAPLKSSTPFVTIRRKF